MALSDMPISVHCFARCAFESTMEVMAQCPVHCGDEEKNQAVLGGDTDVSDFQCHFGTSFWEPASALFWNSLSIFCVQAALSIIDR